MMGDGKPIFIVSPVLVGALVVFLFAWSFSPATAGTCPAALVNAQRLLVVNGFDLNLPDAILETYQRDTPSGPWRRVGGMRSAAVGLKGLAWGAGYRDLATAGEPLKREGDLKSPMGIYALGPTFGFDGANFPGHLKLEAGRHVCVEEPRSRNYGRIVSREQVEPGIKYDEMAKEPLYRRGVVVDYTPDAANKSGSCIFIHVWRKPGKGTAGCVALDETDVAALQEWASQAPAAIAIVTSATKDRFAGCLP